MSCPFHNAETSEVAPRKEDHQSSQHEQLIDIPQPPVHWFTKNLPEMDPEFPNKSLWRLADVYGPIFKLDLLLREVVVISSHELINEVFDEDRFDKSITGGLEQVRVLTGDGLFTAWPEEKNWWKAHRILMPVFGPLAVKKMFPVMLDIASQMTLKWDRLGAEHEISVSDDFTRLAFDTIALAGFGYRFNSFYLDQPHEFAQQMAEVLTEAGRRATRPAIETKLRIFSAQQTQERVNSMWKLCDDLLAERVAHPQPDAKDVLNTMLNITDPETGEKMSDENIRFNMVTFLAAGHETTSGTLAFLMYHLLKNPEAYHKAQQEVDEILGDNALELKHVPQFKYIEACLRETLRYQGPISSISLMPKEDTAIGVKYAVKKGELIQANLVGLHHDPKVWGDDVNVFRPERFLDGGFEALPRNAWKPFGNGRRACIGRAFAEQEMIMVVALLLQRFQIEMADPSYHLHLKSTLTVKPSDFKIRVRRRPGKDSMVGFPGAPSATSVKKVAVAEKPQARADGDSKGRLTILYGSNAGTCKYLAEDLEMSAKDAGYTTTVQTMDSATEHMPTDEPVVIITPSYEGKPADNAKKFVTWLEACTGDVLKGTQVSVFGVGNSEWTSTYHRIPKLVHERLEALGASHFHDTGYVNAREDLVGPWEEWKMSLLSKLTGGAPNLDPGKELQVEISKPGSVDALAGAKVSTAIVRKNGILSDTSIGPEKHHLEVELPKGMAYQTGDYLVVLPTNPPNAVRRALRKFHLHPDDVVKVSDTSKSYLVSEGPSTALELLGARVELSTPISQRQLRIIAKTASNSEEAAKLEHLASDEAFKSEVLDSRASILDILEDYASAQLSFAAYLDMLKPLSPRQYSISSAPIAGEAATTGNVPEDSYTATITFDKVEAPARSGKGRVFQGVASSYLASRPVGDSVRCFVRPTNAAFHLPPDPNTPVVMVCAGTGIAPMRGFIEERAQMAAAGRKLGKALLYFGCRHHEKDFIYKQQLQEWENIGAVELRPTFSKVARPGLESHKYVHERIWAERQEISSLFENGAKIFVCGSAAKLAKSTAEMCQKVYLEKNPSKTADEAFEWLQEQREDRYVSDVFD